MQVYQHNHTITMKILRYRIRIITVIIVSRVQIINHLRRRIWVVILIIIVKEKV
jgi:hypothetical protein